MANLETTMRTETTCRGCGRPKETGLIVCWPCFKYRTDITPYKYFDGTLAQWLDHAETARLARLPGEE